MLHLARHSDRHQGRKCKALLPMSYKWHTTRIWRTIRGSPQNARTGAGSPCNKRPCANRVWPIRSAAARPWPLPSDGAEGRPPHQHRQIHNSQSVTLRTCTSPFVLPGRKTARRQRTEHRCLKLCLVLRFYQSRFHCSIIARQDSWPSIHQRTAHSPYHMKLGYTTKWKIARIHCQVGQYALMSSKAYCRPYIWYVFVQCSLLEYNAQYKYIRI